MIYAYILKLGTGGGYSIQKQNVYSTTLLFTKLVLVYNKNILMTVRETHWFWSSYLL